MVTENNVSQLSKMALEAKTSSEMIAIKTLPTSSERIDAIVSTRPLMIDSTDNVADVSLAQGDLGQDAILKSDTYFPININLPTAGGTGITSTTPTIADEDAKRKKMIMIASIVLAVIVLVIVFMSFKKSK